jgi:hypothetical protein
MNISLDGTGASANVGMRICDNILSSTTFTAIVVGVSVGGLKNLQISNNQIHDWASDESSATTQSAISLIKTGTTQNVSKVSITDNVISITGTAPTGSRRGISVDLDCISAGVLVANNVVDMNDASPVQMGFYANLTGTAGHKQWVFEGNIMKGGGVDTSATNWPPTKSIAIGNISDDGTFNWSAIASGFTVFANNIDS